MEKTTHYFRNIHSKRIASYKKREIVDGKHTIHILVCDGVEDNWSEDDFKKHWVIYSK
ncbi:hypothetical protein [Pseudanabaena sp. 'Roaring Creek']|uniref:hypothetical protein n=1 Tax=Pseudanabaena sp. 'Roaring Creek' TaxID=1681830 RepID=UPI000AECF27A|nr:hypothetical protein [Pseudanabaena sp. 'Roaring Creek']